MMQVANTAVVKSGYAPVNGLKIYYKIYEPETTDETRNARIHGAGVPLLALHGGLGSTEMFGPILPLLGNRRVIAVDLHGHGCTADIDRPIRYEAMGDDIFGLMKYLGIEKADILGYSLGGGTGLRTAIQHPEVVRKLVSISAVFARDGWYTDILAQMSQMGPALAEQMKPSPIYKAYSRSAPRPADWPVLVTKVGDLLRKHYDWSKDVAAMKTPTMLVFGDADSIRPAHEVEFFQLLGGGQKDPGWDGSGMPNARLAILPAATHYNMLESPLLAPAVRSFLDAPMPAAR